MVAEGRAGPGPVTALGAGLGEGAATRFTKAGPFPVLMLTAWAAHGKALGHGHASGLRRLWTGVPMTPPINLCWMLCQYSRAGPVSSEKHQGTPGTVVER